MKNGYTSQKEVCFIALAIFNGPNSICDIFLTLFYIVEFTVKARKVTVKGAKGEITKSFRHMPVELTIQKQNVKKRRGQYLNIKMWFAGKK